MRLGTFVFCAVLFLQVSISEAATVSFAGGTGEPNNPYQIATAEQLIGAGADANLCAKCFVLTADIDLDPRLPGRRVFEKAVLNWTTTSTYAARGGTQVLVTDLPFAGRFDGNGHVIRNSHVNSTSGGGFFLSLGPQGNVCNLHLRDILVGSFDSTVSSTWVGGSVVFSGKSGSYSSGALAGNNEGVVDNCSATGTLFAPATVGGLVGHNKGVVSDCTADCRVYGYDAGGLVGSNGMAGQIKSSSSDSVVYAGDLGGGLVGSNAGMVQDCRSGGYVGGLHVGGMAGDNSGTISQSHAAAVMGSSSTSSSTAPKPSGGLVYQNTGTVVSCYTTGTAQPGVFWDGLVAVNTGTVSDSYSTTPALVKPATTSSGGTAPRGLNAAPTTRTMVQNVYYLDPNRTTGASVDPNLRGYGIPLSADEMKQQASFVNWDFSTIWAIEEGVGYPYLRWEETADDK